MLLAVSVPAPRTTPDVLLSGKFYARALSPQLLTPRGRYLERTGAAFHMDLRDCALRGASLMHAMRCSTSTSWLINCTSVPIQTLACVHRAPAMTGTLPTMASRAWKLAARCVRGVVVVVVRPAPRCAHYGTIIQVASTATPYPNWTHTPPCNHSSSLPQSCYPQSYGTCRECVDNECWDRSWRNSPCSDRTRRSMLCAPCLHPAVTLL